MLAGSAQGAMLAELGVVFLALAKTIQARTIVTSIICRAELRYGQNLMAHEDKRRKAIDLLLHELPALPFTAASADRYGEIQAYL